RYIGERSLEKISITSITIPEGVVYVGSRAFQSVTTLQSVVVPSTVEIMRGYSFDGCTNLTIMYINRPSSMGVTGIQVSTFNNCPSLTHLYVVDPTSEAAYKTATNWKSYAAKISVAP
ncbi:MAG: leucine-rich repeat domain-containing protein, partial [Firmicutes bacterium]|nr:leucine-rich repeat domain-containing protein [Bacillota bacterium]